MTLGHFTVLDNASGCCSLPLVVPENELHPLMPKGHPTYLRCELGRIAGSWFGGYLEPQSISKNGVIWGNISSQSIYVYLGNLLERLVVVSHGWQSEATDGPTGG